MQMALSGQTYAYLVAHMPKNPVLHCYWREHMHFELLEFNAEYQDRTIIRKSDQNILNIRAHWYDMKSSLFILLGKQITVIPYIVR